ncbi:MAG: hypothetical protein KatS3mg063_0538 [Tepidiforma sp.]|uniref:hypothetical protein n=1 Tax=Tepidiforma sp. TaxID=2682230 RepID=UPI0021DBEE71|nr:hypothetical protein [Tepidiforma sp.]GIW14685.1 MAG: hypothetical protein KatS3mg063_0538 [Tepidiforma sp.]
MLDAQQLLHHLHGEAEAGAAAHLRRTRCSPTPAYLYVGSTTAEAITAQGPAITLLGDKSLCKRDITICKVLEDNGDGYSRPAGTFVLTVNDGSQTTQHALDAAEGGQAACKTVTVPANATVTVGEAATRPANWNGDADGYPKVTQDGNTYTVTNKEKPITVTVTFVKKVCDTFKRRAANNGSNLNAHRRAVLARA